MCTSYYPHLRKTTCVLNRAHLLLYLNKIRHALATMFWLFASTSHSSIPLSLTPSRLTRCNPTDTPPPPPPSPTHPHMHCVDNALMSSFSFGWDRYAHGDFARGLLKKLALAGTKVINSAVFNAGFLTGGDVFDYRKVTRESDPELFAWRDKFNAACEAHGVKPAVACVQFRCARMRLCIHASACGVSSSLRCSCVC
jgi:hypothetical protein